MKLRTHLIYLAAITVVCYVAIANIVKLNDVKSGKSMYVANFNDLQSQLAKTVKNAVDENANKTDYGAVMNEILASGKIKLTHNDAEICSIQFSNLKQSDGITSPYVTMNFKTPMKYYDGHMDGVSFVYREGVQLGYVSKSVKEDKVKE